MPASKARKGAKKYDPTKSVRRIVAWGERKVAERPINADAQRDIGIAAHIAFERLRTGGDKDSLYILATAFDVAHELAVKGCGAEYMGELEAAMHALVSAKKRANLTGAWVLNAEESALVATGLEIHDAQLEAASRAVVVKALADVMERVSTESKENEFESMMLEAA
jgi:hypothetical protein